MSCVHVFSHWSNGWCYECGALTGVWGLLAVGCTCSWCCHWEASYVWYTPSVRPVELFCTCYLSPATDIDGSSIITTLQHDRFALWFGDNGPTSNSVTVYGDKDIVQYRHNLAVLDKLFTVCLAFWSFMPTRPVSFRVSTICGKDSITFRYVFLLVYIWMCS